MISLKCFHCGNEMTFVDRIPRLASCSKCNEDVHVCKNCQFYDPKVYNGAAPVKAGAHKEMELRMVFTP